MRATLCVTLLTMSLAVAPAFGQLDKIMDGLKGRSATGGNVSDAKANSGLKQALEVGTDNAVKLTGVTDGFFKNQAIKILLPEKFRTAEKGMRMVGMGPKLDEFELSMNRAAEAAAPAAKGIFKKAITQMSFDDVRKILTGGDTAATEFFKEKTSADLKVAFKPTIENTMAESGVVKQYSGLTKNLQALPFGKSANFDITDYVVGKSLDGLFYMLGQEEKKIRTNPASQVTPLLREVFGGKH